MGSPELRRDMPDVPDVPTGLVGIERGRAARARIPRSGHAVFDPARRSTDAITVLERQAASRVAELVPLRYVRMASSPFAFFRGAAAVMAADLAAVPDSGLLVQLCGDAHLSNFGLFGTPERRLVFDINDFDETLPGPFEWDLKRLCASLVIACQDSGFAADTGPATVRAAVDAYVRAMHRFAAATNLEVWYASASADDRAGLGGPRLDRSTAALVRRTVSRARTRDHLSAFDKLVASTPDGLRFVHDPPLLVPVENLVEPAHAPLVLDRVRGAMRGYRGSLSADRRRLLDQYDLVHVARKVVGVGSVGTRAWIALLVGRYVGDPIIVQIKEAQASVLEEHTTPSRYDNAGQRVVVGQRLMQASSDILLGWQRYAGFDDTPRDFYVRQLRDWKGTVEVDQMSPAGIRAYARLCAWTLARAHARSGDRVAIAAYLGRKPVFARALTAFACAYAEQNERDHAALVAAVSAGTLACAATLAAP